jgi:hypothetical protein
MKTYRVYVRHDSGTTTICKTRNRDWATQIFDSSVSLYSKFTGSCCDRVGVRAIGFEIVREAEDLTYTKYTKEVRVG